MHMFEIFKIEFVVWLDLNSKEKIKEKGIRNSDIKKTKEARGPHLSVPYLPNCPRARPTRPPWTPRPRCAVRPRLWLPHPGHF
jgi:hypothetical protein